MEEASIDPSKLGDFDPKRVQWRDPKTGRVIKVKPYRLVIENHEKFFEYPKHSGNLWYENRMPAGRWEHIEGKRVIKKGAEHVEYVAPLTADEKIMLDVLQTKEKNRQLEAELAAIKAEQEAAVAAKPKTEAAAEKKVTTSTKTIKKD